MFVVFNLSLKASLQGFCVLPLYLVTTVELRHCGSWKVTVSVMLLLTLRRTIDGASGAPEQGHTGDRRTQLPSKHISPETCNV